MQLLLLGLPLRCNPRQNGNAQNLGSSESLGRLNRLEHRLPRWSYRQTYSSLLQQRLLNRCAANSSQTHVLRREIVLARFRGAGNEDPTRRREYQIECLGISRSLPSIRCANRACLFQKVNPMRHLGALSPCGISKAQSLLGPSCLLSRLQCQQLDRLLSGL